ncbi:hypothetical protein ABT009_03880 [Streptomyces sp. NPDC002896]|uniref:hypothetical protein n=1 Tax=Streptomyces sp. NPDC002896 TaxID=3154438 RepID=UPI00331E95A4
MPAPCTTPHGLAPLTAVGTGNRLFTTALSRVRPHETGSAAGLLNAVQQLGATLGTAVLGTAFLRTIGVGAVRAAGVVHAAQVAFWLAAGLLAATTMTASLMLGRHLQAEGDFGGPSTPR